MTSEIPGTYISKKKGPKQRRKAFVRVLTATLNEQPADEDDLQLLSDYSSNVERKISREAYGHKYRPLYEVVTAILPEAIRLHRWVHEDAPRLVAAGVLQPMARGKGGTAK